MEVARAIAGILLKIIPGSNGNGGVEGIQWSGGSARGNWELSSEPAGRKRG